MKSIIRVVAIASVLAVPGLSFAQSNQPLTRADVNAQLEQVEQTNPSHAAFADSNASYPAQIQAAEAKVTAQNGTAAASFGGVADSTSGSGAQSLSVSPADWHSMYDHS